ncbi:MAG TPA: protein kinase [Planctomycetota bacterium]|nr:protein kinase [Planctomycetota bacterium]
MAMRIGRYEVLGQVGRGAAGVVFRARSPEGGEVAVKVLLRTDAGSVARFEREKRLLSSFGEAEGFVPLLDAGADPNGAFIVMPFLAGGTLRARLARGALGTDETVTLGRDVAAAVGRAHRSGVVHRDLKPENILFTADGRPLVADLGIAKHFAAGNEASVGLSRTNDVRGTVGYMPPEQMVDARSVGPAADVFALGAILFECLAGTFAFSAPSLPALVDVVQAGKVPSLTSLRPDAPRWLVTAIERALAKDPARRFPDGAALEAALRTPEFRRSRSSMLAAAGIAFVVAATAVALVLGGRSSRDDPVSGVGSVTSGTHDPARSGADARRLVEQSARDRKAQRYHAAIEAAEQAIQLDPTRANAWAAKGAAEYERMDFEAARRDLDRALALDPALAESWALRGRASYRLGDKVGARAGIARAIELDRRSAPALSARALLSLSEGDLDAASRDVKDALAIDPRSLDTFCARFVLRGRQLDPDAFDDISRAGSIDPRVFGFLVAHTEYFPELPGGDSLMGTLAAYIVRRPTEAWALALHASIKVEAEGAAAEARRALELAPGLPIALYARACVRSRAHDNAGALEDLDKAVAGDPGFATAWALAADLRRGTDHARARRAVDRALELDARSNEALRVSGRIREDENDFDCALADFERAVALVADDVQAQTEIAFLRKYEERVLVEDEAAQGSETPKALESDDPWEWVSADPTPFSGARCVRTRVGSGFHQLRLVGPRWPIRRGERFLAQVWLDPENPPRAVVLSVWNAKGAHSVFWGEEGVLTWRRMGPRPEVGKWTTLEVAASVLDVESSLLIGVGLGVLDGRAAWDHVVKR